MPAELTATHFGISGASTEEDFRAIWEKVAEVADIGAIAFEKAGDGRATMIIKHKVTAPPDAQVLAEKVRSAGEYDMIDRTG